MAKNSILDYDTTPDNKTDMGGIGIQGTSAVNNFDNAFRTLMSQIADFTGGSTIASGTTTDLSSVKGQYVTVSGTSTITSFGTAKAGWMKFLRFTGVATITYNATSMILPGASSITTTPGDYALFVSEGSGNWRCLNYFSALSGTRPVPKGQLYGLTLSNNAGDAVNDIDISAGECATDSAIPSLMILASSLTKRLDAAWAVGTGNGGLDTGSIADTTYHVWLIQRSDTGVVDALFSASATAPTMPTGYDRKRRIGSIIRKSGAILAFTQSGDEFLLATVQEDVSQTNPGTSALTLTLTVPAGIVVDALLHTRAVNSANLVTFAVYISSLVQNNESITASKISLIAMSGSNYARETTQDLSIRTDTSRRIRALASSSDANCTLIVGTYGWVDLRGRV